MMSDDQLAVETCTPPYELPLPHGDAATYTSECRYCLAAGDYELHTYDEWGDGWGAGSYTLAMEGCDELHGSQGGEPRHHTGCVRRGVQRFFNGHLRGAPPPVARSHKEPGDDV